MFYIHGLLPERFSPSQRIHIWPAHIRNMWVKLKKAVLVSAHFWSPIDFSDLRSHLLIIHTLLFSRQYKSMPTSLPSNKLYWDLTRVRKNRICPNCKRRSANFPKSWQEWKKKGNGVMGRGKWTIPFNKGSLNHSLSARQLSSCFSRGGHKYTQQNFAWILFTWLHLPVVRGKSRTTEICSCTRTWSISGTIWIKLGTSGLNLGTKRPCVRNDWIPY